MKDARRRCLKIGAAKSLSVIGNTARLPRRWSIE
jgi:hypothetical protein